MNRNQAYLLLTQYIKNQNLLKHCLAAETSMRGIYKHLHKDDYNKQTEENWGITGLLHDIDYEVVQKENKLDRHGIYLFETHQVKLPDNIEHAIKAHNFENTGVEPLNDLDWAITTCDQLTGLIVAATLVLPDKKLASLAIESILKRFKEKSFAKGADRKMISYCEEKLGIPLSKFIEICLASMKEISDELGL